MQSLTASARLSAMEMSSDVLSSHKQGKMHTIDIGLIAAAGLWTTHPTLTRFDPNLEGHPKSCTPQLLSSSNSDTCSVSTEGRKGKKTKRRVKSLFKNRLSLSALGVKTEIVNDSNLEYAMPVHQQHRLNEMKQLPSQELLIFKSTQMPSKPRVTSVKFNLSNDSSSHVLTHHPQRPCFRSNTTTRPKTSSPKLQQPTLTQLKIAAKAKLTQSRQYRTNKKHKNAKYKVTKSLKHNRDEGQEVEMIRMNTGTLCLYRGGGLPRKAVFVRNK